MYVIFVSYYVEISYPTKSAKKILNTVRIITDFLYLTEPTSTTIIIVNVQNCGEIR